VIDANPVLLDLRRLALTGKSGSLHKSKQADLARRLACSSVHAKLTWADSTIE
jgi:hypothetical protein